jgi:polysaccharide pyruvyl transferase WcaK-like protein
LSPQTLGPFEHPVSRKIGLLALNSCEKIFARDQLSIDRIKQISRTKLREKVQLTTDVAFALPTLETWPATFPTLETGKKHIGINVSGLMYQGGYNGENQFGLSLNYQKLVRTLLEELSQIEQYKVWLIPHVYQITRPALESDRAVSEKLALEFPAVELAPQFLEAREAKSFLSKMDLVLAARMHAAIGAVSSGVACIPMSYSIKFQGLFESIGYSYTLDMKTLGTDEALETIRNTLAEIPQVKTAALEAAEAAQDQLENYRTYIKSLLA